MPTNTRGQTEPQEPDGGCVPGLRLVRLDRTTPEVAHLRRAVLRHRLAPGQSRYTGLPVATLPAADADPDRFPFAVVRTGAAPTDAAAARLACVGFGIIDRGAALVPLVDAPERAVLLRAYYVTPEWQGRGVGRAACAAPLLDLLVAGVAPATAEIVLCVNEANHQAERVYAAAGFAPTGRRIVESAGPQLVMSRPLATGVHHAPLPRHERTENTQ
ncbi:N-acetyltransferase [Nocardiopsis sp. NRRL B-16309]|uniref:GNAT family N-acetyltransferase n=1 Tax=Nocardiopsis sp. NRRL B-16309 TaxID=1519494 RepID=UPI0006AE5664|nr:GNAT family N-acetyltransferase [Nocardiopsis sp. NRRL B-16309]